MPSSRVSLAGLAVVLIVLCLGSTGVDAEATDATKSESSGSGLQFATAGILAQFTVTAKDESGVRRTSGGDEWIVELDGTRSLTGSVVDNLDGTYQVSYTATKSGSYEAGVKLAKSGGLTGSYFENVWFFYTPVKVTVDPQINMDWGNGLITPTGANYISIRWVGKVKTQYAETYTFFATTDDGARLWIDNVPLIDRWDSYCNETSATIALSANVFYNIKMEYKQVTGSAFARLSWASQSTPKEIVPSSQLYYETQAKKSPFSFIVMPNVANGTRSTAAGTGLVAATAGTGAQFTIQANDMYDNERGEGGDIFSVRVYPPGSIEVGLEGRAVHGVVVDNTDSSYSVEYTTYKSGNSTLYAALLVRGGITATYYDSQDFTLPVKYAEGTQNLQKVQFSPILTTNNDNSVPTVSEFSVRYAGFVAPTKDSQYQFMWKNMGHGDRVKLWVDNSLIIDQWSSMSSTAPTGTIELRSAYYYDTRVDYRMFSGCVSGSCVATQLLQWAPSAGVLGDVTSQYLYRGYNIMGSPYTVAVQPAGTCAAKSIAVPNQAGAGHSLELSTAGLQAEFTITAKDLYGNLRLTGGDNFKVRLTGVDSTSGLVQDLSPSNPGAYRVVYTATKSGTYDISVVFGASGINQSPFRMVTQPARRHLARSVASGVGLTLTTAGVMSAVTITIKDRHDNWQPDPSVVEAHIGFSLIDKVTLQPTNVVQNALTPDDIPRFVDTVSYIGPSTNAGHQVATPTYIDNPRLILRFTATRSGMYSLAVAGQKANDGAVMGSPFDLNLAPNVACATTSSATGDSLSLATAGIPGVFTIQARDQYYNRRGSNSGDNFVARVRQYYSVGTPGTNTADASDIVECGRLGAICQSWNTYNYGVTTVGGRDKPATIVDRGDGTYAVTYTATRSTTNYLWAAYAVAGGLQATYYQSTGNSPFTATGSNRVVQVDQTVDFSVSAILVRQPTAVNSWSARWTGLVKPSLSETYTFYAGEPSLSLTERAKLWVDNSLVFHQWNSLVSASAAPSGKIDLVKDQYYEILLSAMSNTNGVTNATQFQLKWNSNHHSLSVISSSRLFQSYHVENSPFNLNVLPATTCAGTSRVFRPALTITTAGIVSSFTVMSKDAFDNVRTLAVEDNSMFDFAILANATLPKDNTDSNRVQPSEDNGGVLMYQADTFYIGGGGYQVNYTATKQGVYNIRGQIMQPGGVFGTYFENDDLTDHGTDTLGLCTEAKPYQRMDSTIDFEWNGARPVPAPSTTMKKDIGPSYFSARWQGMVEPMHSEVYTFHALVDDGAKLWINDLLIIDQWYSRCSEVDGTIALMANTMYPLKLEYKQIIGNATVQLRWSSRSQSKTIVPSSSLFSNTTTYNLCNRNFTLYVEPAIVCASKSTANGAGLTGATAGQPAKFTIQSRDEYMNNRKLSDSGIRPGSAAFACDDWAHSGALNPASTHTLTELFLDPATASSVNDYYTGRTITITGGTGAGQSRIIQDYLGADGSAAKGKVTVSSPPLTILPDSSSMYSITNYGGQFSERCDETRTQAFRKGFPEFHVRVTPVIEGSQAPYHAYGIVDQALIETQLQGSGISRLSSTEYPGGLTATYYDVVGSDPETSATYNPGFSNPVFSTWCTAGRACDQTIDFSTNQASHNDSTLDNVEALKLTYGEYPEAAYNLGVESGGLAATYYDHQSMGWLEDYRLTNREYAVRWSGFISPTLAGVYTFQTHFSDATAADDRVKLWIDNKLVIQQWASLELAGKAQGTFHFASAYPSAYTISVHYRNPIATGAPSKGGMTLRWENLATGSTISGVHYMAASGVAHCSNSAAFLTSLCLATISSSLPFTQVLSSSYGTVSDAHDAYVGQIIEYAFGGGATTSSMHYIEDYYGVVSGTCRKQGTATEVFLDVDASTTDSFYVDHWLHITAGTGAGQALQITAYTGCDVSGCNPYTTVGTGTLHYCDCSGANHKKITVSGAFSPVTDATSKYRIAMYRAKLSPALGATKTVLASFSIATGYTLVTYGNAECAEFTGVAIGGGPSTTSNTSLVGDGASDTTLTVTDADLLFGQITVGATAMWVAVSAQTNIKVTAVSSGTLLTITPATVPSSLGAVSCSTVPCSVVPRNTIILDANANTELNFYDTYYIHIISGTCAGQWREVKYSKFFVAQNYVTAGVAAPWTTISNSDFMGCTQPDSLSVYYLSKVCTHNIVTLQTVGPLSSLTIKPGTDGEAILESAQNNMGSGGSAWNPAFYGQLATQGDNYPYPYQPYDHACCKAVSGNDNNNYYANMMITITSGTGRGQTRFTTGYTGTNLQLTVTPDWTVLPDSTSRYAIYRAKQTAPQSAAAGAPKAFSPAPVVPSTRLFPLRSRYEVTYTPTVKGDYQVHATLAQGSGLDATYYDDMELSVPVTTRTEDTINFDVENVQTGFGIDVPRSMGALGLSDKQSFSVRWAGLLQMYDDVQDTTPNVFTFEAGIAETDERVKVWVDNSLIIDRWEPYDYLSGTTFSATIGLRSPYYYDLKMEYKQYAGASAQAVLRWHCSIPGSACQQKSVIPSGNLFQAREVSGSPFPPHEVLAGFTCADRSTVRGIVLSLATAGVSDSFTIQAHDMYDNERGVAGDMFVVRAVPYGVWDAIEPYATARGGKDCISCPSTVTGSVEDMGDSSYVAHINATKKGAYKVLTSLAVQGGLTATYYAITPFTALNASRFHRTGQVADSESDWPAPCVFHNNLLTPNVAGYTTFNATVGSWRGYLSDVSAYGRWQDSYQCQNWISGTARNGLCLIDSGYRTLFAQCQDVGSPITPFIPGTVTPTTIDISAAYPAARYPTSSLVGMIIYVTFGAGVGQWTKITAHDGAGVITHAAFSVPLDGTSKIAIKNCGYHQTATTEAECFAVSTVLQPTTWYDTLVSDFVMFMDEKSSHIDSAYDTWNVKITGGKCKGQVREIKTYIGKTKLALLNLQWSNTDGIMIADAYGLSATYSGCTGGPDSTSTYILYHEKYAPGSMDSTDKKFGVRWAGFVKPSSTTEYTFQTLLAGPPGRPYSGAINDERVKLWVDNRLVIDQWVSLASTKPSGTIAFNSASGQLFDIQVEYKRVNGHTQLTAFSPSAGEPYTLLPPRMTLRWKNEQSGSDALLSEAYDYHPIPSSRLYTSFSLPNSRVLDLQVAETNPAVSTARGDGLTAATAGSSAYFTITAKDSFANDRELEEDSFVVTVEGPNGFKVNAFPVPSPSMPGTYEVTYVATQSGSYDISVRRANAGGLLAEYFNNMWLLGDPAITVVDPEVSYTWGAAAVAPAGSTGITTGADYMSVRWSGLFKPELSEEYTFFAKVDAGVRMYLDGSLVVNQWDVAVASEYSATLGTSAGLMYELKLEYRHVTGDASAELLYSAPSIAKRVIPSSRLFNAAAHIYGSPFKSFVSPTATCSTASMASGPGLSFATAGHSAWFTLVARDEYLNSRTKWEDTFVAKASQTDHLGRSKSGVVSANVVKGKYNVAYLVTKAGSMSVYASLAVAGGVMATYYDSVSATYYSTAAGNFYGEYSLPSKATATQNVFANNIWSIEGGATDCDLTGTVTGTGTCESTSLVQDGIFAARWSGFIRPSSALVYTFHVIGKQGSLTEDTYQERVKLWLDNKLVIDQWNSLASATAPSATFAFPVPMDYYDFQMEYRMLSAPLALQNYTATNIPTAKLAITQSSLGMTTALVQSSYLAKASPVVGSPYHVTVKPDVTDFAVSVISGDALTVGTSGIASGFTITSMDSYGNLRTEGGDQYLVHVSSVGGSVFEGTVTDVLDGTYTVSYTPTIQGTYDVKVYLGSSDKTTTLLVEPGPGCASTSIPNGNSLTMATAGYSATFTIQAKDAFKNLRTLDTGSEFLVKITGGTEVHNNPVQYMVSNPTQTFNNNLGRFTVAYRTTKSGTFQVDIKMAHTNGLNGYYYRDDALENLVQTQVDTSMSFTSWALGAPNAAVGIVDGWSAQWTGYIKTTANSGTYTFKPTIAQKDERVKLWVDDHWIVDQWTSLSAAVGSVSGTIWLVKNTLYDIKMQYTDATGTAGLNLQWQPPSATLTDVPTGNLFASATDVAGSPFTATVFPAKTSGTISTAFGAGLSLATAGVDASFTIQAKDHLGNAKTTNDDLFVVRARHNADYSRRNILGTVTALSGNRGQYSVTYKAQWKRNHLSCATPTVDKGVGYNTCNDLPLASGGSDAVYKNEVGWLDSAVDTDNERLGHDFRVVSGTPSNLIGAKHKFHDVLVSQAVKGGLFATYYQNVVDETTRDAAWPGSAKLFYSPTRTKTAPTVDFSATDAFSACLDSWVVPFGVRYTGFFSPPVSSQVFTFFANTDATENERVRVWIDNSLIIDEWTSLTAQEPTGTMQFGTANGLYDIKIEYKQETTVDSAVLKLQYQYATQGKILIPSTRLYQSHDLTFKIFDQAGLTATYYDTVTNNEDVTGNKAPHKAVQESTVDWSGATATDRPYPTSVVDGEFGVRWTGFVKPSRTDEYTFFTPIQGTGTATTLERVQLWVDNTLIIAQWTSLNNLQPSGTLTFPVANDYYNIVLDYKVEAAQVNRGIQLQWKNLGQSRTLFGEAAPTVDQTVQQGLIPASRLFQIRTTSVVERDDMVVWDTSYYKEGVSTLEDRQALSPATEVWSYINGCPYYVNCYLDPTTCQNEKHAMCRGQGIRVNDVLRVDVKPGPVCAGSSTVSHDGGLSLSTAGITRTFVLTARDEFDNQRDASDDSFIGRAVLLDASPTDRVFHTIFTHQSWAMLAADGQVNDIWNQNGKYYGSYIITRSGQYQSTIQTANVEKQNPNQGLFGTYFATTSLTGTAVTQVDATINFNWGRGLPTTSANIPANAFSARWTGFVRTDYNEVYTFYTSCDYGVRLYIDDFLLVNRWGLAGQEYSGTFTAKSTVLYDVVLEYQTTSGLSFCELWYSSPSTPKQIVPESKLFVKAETIQGGDNEIKVVASIVSSTVSSINGTGLSIATAGVPASFTILSKDMYGNVRDQCNDLMFVRMVPDEVTCTVGGEQEWDWSKGVAGTGVAGSETMCTSRGKTMLTTTDSTAMMDEVSTNTNHGIIGTYGVVGFNKIVPVNTGTSWSDVSSVCTTTSNTGNKHPFSFVSTRAGSHTLYASELPGGKGASYLSATGTGLMATYYETSSFGTPRNAYDCRMAAAGVPPELYDTSNCNPTDGIGSIDFSRSSLDTPGSLIADGIFSARWSGLVRMPATLTGLTFVATTASGVYDERVKLWVDNSLIIDQWTSLAASVTTKAINTYYLPLVNQLYDIKVEYKNVVGGASDNSTFSIKWAYDGQATAIVIPSTSLYPSHDVSGEPLRVRVNPNVAFARECEVYGNGLTLATAGVQATFAIQSKDAYNNKRGTGGDLFIVRAFSDGCQSILNVVGNLADSKATCQPYGPAIATCGLAGDLACPSTTNPPPETNDGGDDDGSWRAGVLSYKIGGAYRTDSNSAVCTNCPRIVRGDVVDNGDGTYKASFTGTQKGRYTVVTSLVNSGGLSATYYNGDNIVAGNYNFGTNAFSYQVDGTVDWSASTAGATPVAIAGTDLSIRWVGFVRPSRASQYTFHTALGGSPAVPITETTERVKLWVDNSIIIQQWASLSSTAPSGTMGFAKANGYYDISMLYRAPSTAATYGYTLKWESTPSGVAADDVSLGTIPSNRLFARYDVPNTGLTCSGTPCTTKDTSGTTLHTTLQIMPSVTCASQSTAFDVGAGVGLTLATAGMTTTFTIQAKDAYENTREDTSAAFTLDLFGSGGSPVYNGQVISGTANAGIYSASYVAENAKNYDLFVKFGADNVKGSPFSTTVKPAVECGTKSTVQGTGLTAASISPSKSAFTIQARDQYGNAKTKALASSDFVVRVVRTSGSGMQGTNGPPPYYGKTAISASPTVHSVFNTPTNDGKYAGYYQVPSTPSPTGYTHYLYASWATVGGVYATYYSTSWLSEINTLGAPIDTYNSNVMNKEITAAGLNANAVTQVNAAATGLWGANVAASAASDFVVRWSGMYKPTANQMYFAWSGGTHTDRVKLWIDNKLIIDQWQSLASIAPVAGYLFDSTGFFDLHTEWSRKSTEATSSTVQLVHDTFSPPVTPIPTSNLYFTEKISGSPYAVVVST